MSQPLTVALPPNLDLADGYVLRVAALDPSTGNVVSGVKVSEVTFEVDLISGSAESLGPFLLVPGPRG